MYYRVTQDFFLLDTISDDIFEAFGMFIVPISAVVVTWNAMPQYLGSPDVVRIWRFDLQDYCLGGEADGLSSGLVHKT